MVHLENRNGWLFDGKLFLALDVVTKACDVRDQLFEAQVVESLFQQAEEVVIQNNGHPWKKPPEVWIKCNIGFSWYKRKRLLGGLWVLRDETGHVLLHSRR